MADNRFINGQQFALAGNIHGAPTFRLFKQTVAGTSSYVVVANAAFKFRVVGVTGIMTGAGGASDTVKVTDGTNDITDTINVATLADKSVFSAATIDDAYWNISVGGDLKVETASGALAYVIIECVRV